MNSSEGQLIPWGSLQDQAEAGTSPENPPCTQLLLLLVLLPAPPSPSPWEDCFPKSCTRESPSQGLLLGTRCVLILSQVFTPMRTSIFTLAHLECDIVNIEVSPTSELGFWMQHGSPLYRKEVTTWGTFCNSFLALQPR